MNQLSTILSVLLILPAHLAQSQSTVPPARPSYMIRCQLTSKLTDMRLPSKITLKDLSVYYYHLIFQDGVNNVDGLSFAYNLSGYQAGRDTSSVEKNEDFSFALRNPRTLSQFTLKFEARGPVATTKGQPARSRYHVSADKNICDSLKLYCDKHTEEQIDLGDYLCHVPLN